MRILLLRNLILLINNCLYMLFIQRIKFLLHTCFVNSMLPSQLIELLPNMKIFLLQTINLQLFLNCEVFIRFPLSSSIVIFIRNYH